MDPRPRLVLKRTLAPGVGVRRWAYDGADELLAPAGAHDELELAWVEQGAVRYRVGQESFTAAAGDVVVIPPGVEHATGFFEGLEGGAVVIADGHLAAVARAMGPAGPRALVDPLVIAGAGKLIALARLLEAEARAPDDGSALAADALAELLAVEVLRRAGAEVPRERALTVDKGVRAAVDTVRARFAEPLSLDDMARAAGMSRFHFSRRFRQATGKSPYRFLVETRLAEAEALLRSGRHTVTDAALSVGFSDLGRFGRMFKARTGATPREYVARARGAPHSPGASAAAISSRAR